MKKFLSKIVSFILCVSISLASSFIYVEPVHAAVDPATALKLAQYVLTATGLVRVADGLVERVTDEQLHSLEDVINTCLGDGSIYLSSNGEYVFNSDSTNAIYEELTNDASKNAKVVSVFSDLNVLFSDNVYLSPSNIDKLNEIRLSFIHPLIVCSVWSTSSSVISKYDFVETTDISYFRVYRSNSSSDFGLWFYDSNGNLVSRSVKSFNVSYNKSGGVFGSGSVNSSTVSNCDFAFSSVLSLDSVYSSIPDLGSFDFNSSYSVLSDFCYCNRSIVVCKDSVSGNSLANKNSGVIYNNYFDIIPSVSQTVIEENNWQNIYNSYITNVNNEYQQIYETNGSVSAEELRAILKDIGDRIDDIISDAGGEIVEDLDDVLTWLQRIYDRLESLEDLASDDQDMLDALEAIKSSLDDVKSDTVYLARLYALLGQILDNMQRGGSGRGYPDIVMELPDNTNIMDFISTGQVIASTLETVMPFAYVPMIQQLFQNLAADPVAPHWEIPFVLHNDFVNIEENIIIDLEDFDPVRQVLNAMIMILFLLWLIWFTFYLTDLMGNLLFG